MWRLVLIIQSDLMASLSNPQIPQAYRDLMRLALRAIDYSIPARYTIRDRLRLAFRRGSRTDFDIRRIRNTCQWLYLAQRPRSLEHKVLRSLLLTWYWDPETNPHSKHASAERRGVKRSTPEQKVHSVKRDQFNFTIRMLNESMGMCIR